MRYDLICVKMLLSLNQPTNLYEFLVLTLLTVHFMQTWNNIEHFSKTCPSPIGAEIPCCYFPIIFIIILNVWLKLSTTYNVDGYTVQI